MDNNPNLPDSVSDHIDLPKISVVTVTYNAIDVVAGTMESILKQTYGNLEYIIIDGASTDGTREYVERHKDKVTFFISEPDNGTYDAMNKAIDIASGEWIIFINAGDNFISNSTISDIFSSDIEKDVDFIYGDYIWKGDKQEVRVYSRPLDLMWQRISFSHQSLFSRTKLMKEKKFDLKYMIVSDYNFYFSCFMEGAQFKQVDIPISVFRAGGLSDVNFLRRTYERWKVVTRYRKDLKVHWYYLRLLLDHYKKKF